jgi:hypothetical protein
LKKIFHQQKGQPDLLDEKDVENDEEARKKEEENVLIIFLFLY